VVTSHSRSQLICSSRSHPLPKLRRARQSRAICSKSDLSRTSRTSCRRMWASSRSTISKRWNRPATITVEWLSSNKSEISARRSSSMIQTATTKSPKRAKTTQWSSKTTTISTTKGRPESSLVGTRTTMSFHQGPTDQTWSRKCSIRTSNSQVGFKICIRSSKISRTMKASHI